MAAKLLPIGFSEVLNLTSLGISQSDVSFKNVTLSSSKYVAVREEGKNNVTIVDTISKSTLRLPVQVDSAIMNPVSKVVAVRIDRNLQILNLEMKSKMKSHAMDNDVVYWKWLDAKTIAIVTTSSCYHWSMDGDATPQKMFDRAAYDGPVQIINYRTSSDGKWLIVGGIASKDGQVVGALQVYNTDLRASQPTMDAHTACFATVQIDGREQPSNLFCFTSRSAAGPRLSIIELGVPKEQAFNRSTNLTYDGNDFPVHMIADNHYGVLFILTKQGYLFLYEIQSAKCIFSNRASQQTMFAAIEYDGDDGGVMAVDQTGRVSHFFVDKKNIVNYICTQMNDIDLGISMARRYDLPGAESTFKQQFQKLMQSGQYDQAYELAASANALRTADTIAALRGVEGGKILLQYFQLIMKKGKLNAIESIELTKLVLMKGGIEHIKTWLKEQKLETSEELGDQIRQHNISLALSVYLRANVPEKVIGCFLSLGAQEPETEAAMEHFKNILSYASRVNFSPDYPLLLSQLLRVNSERARDFALLLMESPEGSKVDFSQTIDQFMHAGDIKSFTRLVFQYLKPRGDREEDSALQTKLFEVNLLHAPTVADALFDNTEFKATHYDRLKIAQLCERAGLYQRALQHYTDLIDIKRCLMAVSANPGLINPEFLLEFFGSMTPEDCMDCLRDLMKYSQQNNLRLVVEVAKKWSDYLHATNLIALFEDFKSYIGLFHYLSAFVNFTDNKEIVFKYIEAAVKLDQLKEVERICRDNDHYDAVEVKEFLLQQNLKDPRPLIHVCDRFDFVPELTQYLYSKNLYVFIEAYVQRMSPKATPLVIGTLIDLNCSDDQITKLLSSVRPPVDARNFYEKLVDEVDKRNRLKILKTFLEARANEGSTDVHVHNGIAKIYVDTNNNAAQFLLNNKYYDSVVVGAFCESRDPHLALVAYKRASGNCDDRLIDVCNKNGFFKDLAKYLVERQDLHLWAKVLSPDNEHRRPLIDQVVSSALPESHVPEEVSTTVKAFVNLPNELIELLERLILHGPADGEFATNKNLQNLLIITAFKADQKRVMDYVKRLNNYDGPDIAKIARDQYQLYEEAFFIFKKFKKGPESIQVLLEYIQSMDRAVEFAQYWDQPDVWSILGKAQLDHDMIKECIQCFLKADDSSYYLSVISAAKQQNLYDELILFLKMARGKVKDTIVEYELIYCYAKTDRLADLEDFLATATTKVQECTRVGDQCFSEELYQAARILYTHVNNNAKLAMCLVRLKLYAEAVEAARKANNIHTWKEVCFCCVNAKEFRLAQMCAMNIIVYMEHLLDLVKHYEQYGYFHEVIAVLEQGINLDRAHQGMFTQLGILYAKYKEEKLMEHIKLFWSKLNIPSLIAACRQNCHWNEAVFLYIQYDQRDQAIETMIEHSAECWNHSLFKEIIKKVSNTEMYYKAITFYLQEHPLLLTDLLIELSTQLDHTRVVDLVSRHGHLPLIEKYLLHVQRENLSAVNEALNGLFVKAENYKSLRQSIDSYNNFDQIALAQQLEPHELLEFRRISAHLYKINKRYERSIELSKKDGLWGDAMEAAAESKERELAENLLTYFVENKQKECFAACLFTCYELIHPDVVLELAWRHQLMNFAMPFMIQALRDFDDKLNSLYVKLEEKEKHEHEQREKEKKQQDEHNAHFNAASLGVAMPQALVNPASAPLALMPPVPVNTMAGPPLPGVGLGHHPAMSGYSQALVPLGQPANPYMNSYGF